MTRKELTFLMVALGLSAAFAADTVKIGDETLEASKLPLISARIIGRELCVIYNIPKGQHATVSESINFMTVTTSDVNGLSFGETIFPQGKKESDGTEYRGIVVLKKPITVAADYDFAPKKVTITAGYQLCLDTGVCLPPKKEKIELTFTLEKQ